MPDITMCQNAKCSKALRCFRFLAIPCQWQSFFMNMSEEECTSFALVRNTDRTVLNQPEHKLPDYVKAAMGLQKQKF